MAAERRGRTQIKTEFNPLGPDQAVHAAAVESRLEREGIAFRLDLEMTQEQLPHLGAWGRDARNERRAPSRVIWGLAALDPSHPRWKTAKLFLSRRLVSRSNHGFDGGDGSARTDPRISV